MFGSELGLGGKFLEMVEQRLGYWPTSVFLYLIVLAVSIYLLKFLYFEALNPLWIFLTSVPPKDIDWPPFIVALITIAILVLVLHALIRLIAIRRAKFEIQNLATRAETLVGEAGTFLASTTQMGETFKREHEEREKQYRQSHEEYERRHEEIEQELNQKVAEAEKRIEEMEQEWNEKMEHREELEQEWKQKREEAQADYQRETEIIGQELDSKLQELQKLHKEIDEKLPSKVELEDLKSKMPSEKEWKEALELLKKVEAEIEQNKASEKDITNP